MYAEEEIVPIVIDNGSGYLKGGFGGEDSPKTVIPAVVGKPKYKGNVITVGVQRLRVPEALFNPAVTGKEVEESKRCFT